MMCLSICDFCPWVWGLYELGVNPSSSYYQPGNQGSSWVLSSAFNKSEIVKMTLILV